MAQPISPATTNSEGLPLFYVVNGHAITCPLCAASSSYHPDEVAGPHVNWEDPDMQCDDCEETVPAAQTYVPMWVLMAPTQP